MISLTRTEYGYAMFSASKEEWRAILAILDAAVSQYPDTELDTFLSGSAETRRSRIRRLAELFSILDQPQDELSRDNILDLMIIIDAMEYIKIEGIDRSTHQTITEQFSRLPRLTKIFS